MADVQSRISRKSSVATRNSQLIKKNTGPVELRPSDILIERFTEWKHITKSLIAYFEGIADIESNTAKELTKLGGVVQVPFRQGNQFLGEGGMQDIFYGIREKTRAIADHHSNLAKTVELSIVQHLQKLRAEIKAHVRNIQMDTGKLANSVAKERELSTKVITDLARSITMLKNTPMGVVAKEDPWFCNMLVARQLQKQVQEENALQKSVIIMQQNSAHFEEGVVRAIQTAWETFDNWSSRMSTQVQETWTVMGTQMKSIQPNTEWIAFAARSDHLLDPETPLRNPDHINYPGKDDPSVIAVHQGMLDRKKRFTSNYSEGYYVLTPAGYLHEHRSSDVTKHPEPIMSLFLPNCTLGAPSAVHARSHKFHLEAGKGKGMTFGREHAYSFRARSHDEMMEWWNDAKQLSKVYLTSSEPMDRSGPVPAAVRAAGYNSDDMEEEEEDGSSVEEEGDEEEDEEEEETPAHVAHATPTAAAEAPSTGESSSKPAPALHSESDHAPGYEAANSSVEIGKNGYAVEKKSGPEADAADKPSGEASKSSAGEPATTLSELPRAHQSQAPDMPPVTQAPTPANAPPPAPATTAGGLLSKFKELI